MNETRKRILEAAEIEFAINGFNGATIREITHRAEVNIAAVNYHFGNKEDLFKEMVSYRIEPINQSRLHLLDNALMNAGTGQRHFMKAIGKGLGEDRDFMQSIQHGILKTVIPRFTQALSNSLNSPKFTQMTYAMNFLSFPLSGTMLQHFRLEFMSGGKVDLSSGYALVDRLVALITGGFKGIASLEHRNRKGKQA